VNFKPRRSEDPDINLAPLIDIVFLLLIFFMVSTTFVHESELEISLPESTSEVMSTDSESLEIAIDANGRYALNGRVLESADRETLRQSLLRFAAEDPSQLVLLRADELTPHRYVVRAMDVLAQMGMTRISIATEYRQEDH
jgi:biopolymer transport protein ExbD